jgi:dTDP-4-amino-4,6-dideoxygalactose transaminase
LSNRPAILGGKSAFQETIRIAQPTLFPPDEISKQLSEIFSSGQITNSKYVRVLEEEAAHYLGTKHAVAVSSCTSGLMLLEQALGLTGEVIVPSFTFCATTHSLLWNNLKPVFVDCERETYNIDPTKVNESVSTRTSAILAVDIFGNPCNRETLQKIASARNLRLIIDAAHSFGALYNGGKIGSYGEAQVISLSPTKMVVAGEGGIVITNSEALARRLRIGRNYGNPEDYDCEFAGLNARMTEMNAIIALKSFAMVEENVTRRNRLADQYRSCLSVIPGISFQRIRSEDRSTYKDFSLLVEPDVFGVNRDELARALAAENIQTRPYFHPPVHRQKAYRSFAQGYEARLPNTEEVSLKALSLPLYSHMPSEQVDKICAAVESMHRYAREIKAALSKSRA